MEVENNHTSDFDVNQASYRPNLLEDGVIAEIA